MGDTRGLHLRCQHGSFGWDGLLIKAQSSGYIVTAACELGDHYLRPIATGGWMIGATPYTFTTRAQALAAHAAYLAQEDMTR